MILCQSKFSKSQILKKLFADKIGCLDTKFINLSEKDAPQKQPSPVKKSSPEKKAGAATDTKEDTDKLQWQDAASDEESASKVHVHHFFHFLLKT